MEVVGNALNPIMNKGREKLMFADGVNVRPLCGVTLYYTNGTRANETPVLVVKEGCFVCYLLTIWNSGLMLKGFP